MQIEYISGIGKRETNQDIIYIDTLDSGASFFLIADGMGGYEKGDEAATIISESIFTFLNYVEKIDENAIQKAIQKANLAIKQFNTKNNIKSGATIGGIIIENNNSHLFWVGDVMIFQIREWDILFQSKSHTLINSLKESNNITDTKSIEKYRHVVTRSISGKPSESTIGYSFNSCFNKDLFIICSDGVHDTISIEKLIFMLKEGKSLKVIEQQLEKEAQDNYSLIILQTD